MNAEIGIRQSSVLAKIKPFFSISFFHFIFSKKISFMKVLKKI